MGGRVEVGRLVESDLEAVARLYEQFWGEPSSVERMREAFRRLESNPDYVFLAAKNGGELLGTATGILCSDLYGECRPFMVVENFVVDAGRQRTGVGSALMRELEAAALERDCTQTILVTESDRVDAVSFYESLGYESRPYRGFKKRLPGG
ncbi:MAG: GNAT family N-acetyltransferase [Actinomycetota bacterium]|nr:MAG: N-acetyltransferase [Actinomycetota bacterium]MDP3630791.1 GNAT family N-acetyltransferase [Actinomycetota bacterium]